MTYSIKFPLPEGWVSETDQYEEMEGEIITHMECHLPSEDGSDPSVGMDIYIGDMPADTTAEDEAFANYADIIGWDDDEEEEENPIAQWKFQNRKAYGFSGMCEDDSVMLVMCVEIKKGALLICSVVAKDDATLSEWSKYLEYHLRIS